MAGHYTGYRCMCMQSMNLIWPSMWSGGVLTDDANDNNDDDDRQTNHDCIGSRPTFCREPINKPIDLTLKQVENTPNTARKIA